MIDYLIFGIVDNGVMILGAFTGLSIESKLPKHLQTGLGAVYGAGIGNACSDFMGGAVTASWDLAFGTGIGCILALILVPGIAKIRNRIKAKTR